jgi:hypothetical protein
MRPALPLLALALLVCLSPAATAQSEFTATFESDAITLDEDSRNVTLSVTGRTGTNVTVTSPDLNDSTVAELFDGQQTTDGVQVFVPEDGTLTVTFPARFECLPGKYRFTLRDGEATTNASITVFESGESKAAFTDSVTRVRPGGLAEIGIAVDRCSDVQRLRVAIRSNATEFRANVTVAPNGSGDVRGSLLFDTGNVSADGFAADGNLSLVEAAVAAPPENGTLPAGEYDLTLSAHGDETDVATLVVESAPQTPTATPTSRPATRTDTVVSTTGAPTRSPDETVTPTRTPLGTTQSPTSVPTPPPSPTATPSPTEAVTTTVPSFDPPGSGLVPAAIVVGFVVVVALLGAVALLGLRL